MKITLKKVRGEFKMRRSHQKERTQSDSRTCVSPREPRFTPLLSAIRALGREGVAGPKAARSLGAEGPWDPPPHGSLPCPRLPFPGPKPARHKQVGESGCGSALWVPVFPALGAGGGRRKWL